MYYSDHPDKIQNLCLLNVEYHEPPFECEQETSQWKQKSLTLIELSQQNKEFLESNQKQFDKRFWSVRAQEGIWVGEEPQTQLLQFMKPQQYSSLNHQIQVSQPENQKERAERCKVSSYYQNNLNFDFFGNSNLVYQPQLQDKQQSSHYSWIHYEQSQFLQGEDLLLSKNYDNPFVISHIYSTGQDGNENEIILNEKDMKQIKRKVQTHKLLNLTKQQLQRFGQKHNVNVKKLLTKFSTNDTKKSKLYLLSYFLVLDSVHKAQDFVLQMRQKYSTKQAIQSHYPKQHDYFYEHFHFLFHDLLNALSEYLVCRDILKLTVDAYRLKEAEGKKSMGKVKVQALKCQSYLKQLYKTLYQ